MAQYDVFISYSRKNSDIAHRIEKDLTSRGYSVWIDRDGIFSGDAFKRVLVKAICDSKMLLFLSSQFSNLSEYTAKEIGVAVSQRKKILPVKLDDTTYNDEVLFDLVNIDFISLIDEKNKEREYQRMFDSIKRITSKAPTPSENKYSTKETQAENHYSLAQRLKSQGDTDGYEFYLRESAEGGFYKAQINLGVHLLKSKSVKYENEGFAWLNLAYKSLPANSEFAGTVFYNIGRCFEFGIGTCGDKNKALDYYRKAAASGNASGQYKMGKYYENEGIGNGLNVNKINQASISTAYKWYKLAADQGNKNAIKALDDLKKYQQ